MTRIFKLSHPIAENVNARPKDVLSAKRFLYDRGFYEPPKWGLTEFPDHALIDAIRDFQRASALRVDGVMKPGGSTEETIRKIQSRARQLQGMGRHGDTLLAHINPAEAMILKAKGGAGTTNPATGLLEFYDADERQGKYIWRTVGDSKVRSSHAELDGKVFSWDDPPEEGHPGEEYNCRCWAEDVEEKKEDKEDCEKIKWEVRAANQRINDLQKPIDNAENNVSKTEDMLEDLKSERNATRLELTAAQASIRLGTKTLIGIVISTAYLTDEIQRLQEKLEEIEHNIGIEKHTLADQKMKLEQLERKCESHRQTAEELSRRYEECVKKQ
ncbi:MAG: minor capsid protein [Rhodospirillaceae bacterium]|nr:minor capsid protein [Rhodospirillaceae bacterium]MBT5244036.1 minor capsid protein [Rhodospirillaceae bacterium]MBT5560856.1 minor capsid protein [Rhodospirillaceae bacterium]MBT6241145.1 minor capsid protein [Rhodospirillaceae bacterium]